MARTGPLLIGGRALAHRWTLLTTLDVDRQDRSLAARAHRREWEIVKQRSIDQKPIVAAHGRPDQRKRDARADRRGHEAVAIDHQEIPAQVDACAVERPRELLETHVPEHTVEHGLRLMTLDQRRARDRV